MKIIVKNKRTKETVELPLNEFKIKFRLELAQAFNSYKNTQEQKDMLLPPIMRKIKDYESDFYFELQWNFNHHQTSLWYIERIL